MKRLIFLILAVCGANHVFSQESLEFIESVKTAFHPDFFNVNVHMFYSKDNPLTYSEELESLAEYGNNAAMVYLGDCYLYGEGTDIDYEKALNWFYRAAMNGFVPVLNYLGICYDKGWGVECDPTQAYRFYKTAAFKGDIDGCFNLAVVYRDGIGTEQDLLRARAWFEKAAEYFPTAQSNVGMLYLYEENYEKAFYWLSKASEENLPIACELLGDCYDNGWGTELDKEKAQAYYKKSYELGNEHAKTKIINYGHKNK